MKLIMVTKDATDYAREVTDFMRDFEAQTGRQIETLDPESPSGIDFITSYGIVQYPTLVAIADDNTMQNMWVGTPLPTVMEVSYYA